MGGQFSQLHPVLQQYFSPIPVEHVGRGEGVFTHVGTPRRWLWPLLRLLEKRGVLVARWQHNVPFRITNRTIASRACAEREFDFADRTWTMRDDVVLGRHGRVVDELGEPGVVVASFDITVHDQAVTLTSRQVGRIYEYDGWFTYRIEKEAK